MTVRRGRARLRRESGDAGLTLIETVITVWLIGAVMVAMSGALFTMTVTGSTQHRESTFDTAVQRYAEQIKAAKYVPCAGANGQPTYQSLYPAPAGVVFDLYLVGFWQQKATDDATIDFTGFSFGVPLSNKAGGFRAAVGNGSASDLSLNKVTNPATGSAWARRDRCSKLEGVAQQDDGVQLILVIFRDPTLGSTRIEYILKRCDDIVLCEPPDAI